MDARANLWSLGVVLYEMLAGVRPFQASYPQALLYTLLHVEAQPLTTFRQDLSPAVIRILAQCLQKNKENRYQTAATLYADLYRARQKHRQDSDHPRKTAGAPLAESRPQADTHGAQARIFISYKRNATPDARLAEAICRALSPQHAVFIDKLMLVGTRWVEQIEAELASADFLILLLSAHSIHSEMVLGEIEMAQRLAQERGGRPAILPVRLNYSAPFTYPLSAYLDALNWAAWEDEGDTPRLVGELEKAIAGEIFADAEPFQPPRPPPLPADVIPEPLAAAQPARPLEMPEGTMDPQSAFYVQRPKDEVALRAIARQGVTLTLKGPRLMGKSPLLMRTMAAAVAAGKEVVFLDFQLFDHTALGDAETFFRQFCAWITDELELEDCIEEYWRRPLGNSQRCTRYMGRHLLKALDRPLLLAMDEVERVFDTDFRSDFFSMLRSWHNDRAIKPRWKRRDLALVTSTEPYQLIENLNQSPFNVGEVIALGDFTPAQVADLNRRHGAPLSDEALRRLMALLHGHPYLIRKALFMVAAGRRTIDDLLTNAIKEGSPFGDHLRHHLFRLHGQQELVAGLREVLRSHTCADEGIFWRLRGAGLVRREGNLIVPRCKLYADYFRERLHA